MIDYEINQADELWKEIVSVIQYAVVKYKAQADACETLATKRSADEYINAKLGKDSFETYLRYDDDVIAFVFNTIDETIIRKYADTPRTIPMRYRQRVLARQRKKIIENYVEQNNYYRMLNGLPDVDDTDYIYVSEEVSERYPYIPSDVPIHELETSFITFLDTFGYIDELMKEYPDKKYLGFLGTKKIDLVTSRTAKNFALLRFPTSLDNSMKDKLLLIYEQCREYYHACIYIPEYRTTITYYDNFIGLCIMVMTIQQLICRMGKVIIDRDFFDSYSVKLLFETYGVPFHIHMDSDTRKLLIQNLNLLVQNKGTNKVVYDIGHILGFDRIQVYTYFLMKTRLFDENGNPIVAYKEDPETHEQVLDYEKMFEVYFERSELQNDDLYNSLHDTTNYHDYEEIVEKDSFWIEDAALMRELYESEYNYMETKYLGVSIAYKLTRILFENVYLLKMIFDKKMELPQVQIDISKISSMDVSIFDAIVILCALICKQNKLKGEILFDPTKIMHVIGFNFEDADAIKQDILDNPYLDDSLAEFLDNLATYNVEGINRVFNTMMDLYDELVEHMSTTDSIEAYQAYKKLFNTLYYSKENRWAFNIGTEEEPVYPETYIDYLGHELPSIATFILSIQEEDLYQYINHVCDRLMQIIPDLKYFGFYSDSSYSVEMMLVELIRFFKSYTTELLNMDVIYVLDFKPNLLLRLIDKMWYQKEIMPISQLRIGYADMIYLHEDYMMKDIMNLADQIVIDSGWLTLKDYLQLIDQIILHIHMKFLDILPLISEVQIDKELLVKEYATWVAYACSHADILFKEDCSLEDWISIHGNIIPEDKYMEIIDEMKEAKSIFMKDFKSFYDTLLMEYTATFKEETLKLNARMDVVGGSVSYATSFNRFIDHMTMPSETLLLADRSLRLRSQIADIEVSNA